jgi:amidase
MVEHRRQTLDCVIVAEETAPARTLVVATPRVTGTCSVLRMSAAAPPVARIEPGTSIRLETADCFSDQVRGPADLDSAIDWDAANPATGPVYIEGAKPGDVLVVEIQQILIADHGLMCTGAGWGMLGERIKQRSWRFLTIRAGEACWPGGPSLPIKPMIGVIGVAPAGEAVSCDTPGSHGGNLDTGLIGEGATLYLPVQVRGGLLAAGDLHAAMGDGEVAVTGIEVAGEVTLQVSLRQDLALTDPLLQNDEVVATIASAATLDAAARMATTAMADLLGSRLGIELSDAVMLMSAVGQLRISQMVNPLRTARFEMPKVAYEATYGRLI